MKTPRTPPKPASAKKAATLAAPGKQSASTRSTPLPAGRPSPATAASEPAGTNLAATSPAAATSAPAAFQPKVYKPEDIACPHQNNDFTNCGAEPGEPCVWQESRMEGRFHAERIANAAAASQREGNKPTKEQFDQAALDSDLF